MILDRLGGSLSKLLEKIRRHQQAKPTAEKRAEMEVTAARLRNELQQSESKIREMNRTESAKYIFSGPRVKNEADGNPFSP